MWSNDRYTHPSHFCCLKDVELVSLFSSIIISACLSLLSKDHEDPVSLLETVDATIYSVSVLFNTLTD